jgi:hypothetical protein
MVMKQLRTFGTFGTFVALTAAAVACLPEGAKHGQAGGGDDGSILTSIDGIAPDDQKRADKLSYFLDCGSFREGGSVREKDGKKYIRFDGSQIKDGETSCALEIQAPQDGSMKLDDFDWFGRGKDGVEVKGLMYASNRVAPTNRRLDLKIYVLYAALDPKAGFDIEVSGTLQLAAGEEKPTTASALQLECDGDFKRPGEYVSEAGNKVLLKFKLNLFEARGKKCSKIALKTNAGGKEVEWEAAANISLADVQKDAKLKFPGESVTPYEFTKKPKQQPNPGDPLEVSVTSRENCLSFDTEADKCLDHDAQAIAPVESQSNYIWLKVDGRTANGTAASYVVGAGESGFGLFEGSSVTTAALAESIKATTGRKFNWYKLLPGSNTRELPFDESFVRGDATATSKVDVASLAEFTPMHIAEAWVHGFRELPTLAELNARTAAHWYVTLDVKKDGATVATLLVSGATKYLYSDSPVATLEGGKKVLFDLDSFKQNKPTPGSDKTWAIWSVKGSGAVDAACTMEADYVRTSFSRRHLGTLAPQGGDASLDSCAVSRDKFDQLYASGHELTLEKIWIWEWYQLPKARP